MRGYIREITCCDRDCAGANGCRIGGYQCEDCGKWYCIYEVEEYLGSILCGDCVENRRARQYLEMCGVTEEQLGVITEALSGETPAQVLARVNAGTPGSVGFSIHNR